MKKLNFNKGWLFSLNSGEKSQVDLPHDFSIIQKRSATSSARSSGGYFLDGYGEYEKTFKARKNKKYILIFDGVFGIAEIFVNDQIAYTNKYPYNSFFIDITEYLRYDRENIISVRVNNKAQPNARWYTGSGLYRDVYLCECSSSYIHPYGVHITTDELNEKTAHLTAEIPYVSGKKAQGELTLQIFEDGKRAPVYTVKKCIVADEGENKYTLKLAINSPKIWDVDAPNMYSVRTTLELDGVKDTDVSVFGIRTIRFDTENGLLINGRSVKLRGGCVHHDHGPIGAASYPEAEYRRIARLKAAGFNSIRLSHNPQSPHLYDACDRLGILVIDELFDYWTQGKQTDDFHPFFEGNYKKWVDLIVRRNRCHPSIIMWSTGNEIPQKTGRGNGYFIARNIADAIRSLDTSRPLTHALCSLWDNSEEFALENETKHLPATEMDCFAARTAPTADTVDIVGYNYLEYRIDKDLIRFPQRLIINTETFPICAYSTIKQQLANPRILGDYVWTAWDYFGETGIGHVDYMTQGEGFRLLDYPYHIANCGDIDICGVRKPQSYYREIAWELRAEPYIAPRHPKNTGIPHFPSAWGFYECEHSWCYPEYEGKDIEIYVFGECDKMELWINGTLIDTLDRTDNGVYLFKTQYHSGKVVARAILGDKIYESALKTEGAPQKIALLPEKSYFTRSTKRPDTQIIYVNVEIQDENGALCTQQAPIIAYEAQGADIIGVASGDLTTEELYTAPTHTAYKGRSVVVLRRHGNQKITLTATSRALDSSKIIID